MAVKTTAHTTPDTYLALIKRFPLAHIRDDGHMAAAHQVLEQLLQENLDDGSQMYLDALIDLVETYESEHYSIPDASPADVLRELMRANGLNQPALAKASGITQSTISAVLNGQRSLTATHITTLSRLFHVSSAVFLPA
jgi:HTH-type transcriptional regulator/antitoxin HigA